MKSAAARIDLARFARAVAEGLTTRTLATRFAIHYTTAADWKKKVVAGTQRNRRVPEARP